MAPSPGMAIAPGGPDAKSREGVCTCTQFNKIITQSSYAELVKKMEQKQLEVAEEQKTRTPGSKLH